MRQKKKINNNNRAQWKKGISNILVKIEFEAAPYRYTFRTFSQAVSNVAGNSFVRFSHFFSLGHVIIIINRHSRMFKFAREMDASVSSDLGTPGPPESRCGRKRLRNEENWKRKRRKLHKDSGKSYKSAKGVRKAAKEVMNITCRCSNNCRENVSDEERKRILTGFYGLGSICSA